MRVLATHPGRFGDCLWALPTVRALSETFSTPIDLLLSPRVGESSFRALVQRQIYVGQVSVQRDWEILETAPITPRIPPNLPPGYDRIVHLGYEEWPQKTLPYEVERITRKNVPNLMPIRLSPWIAATARSCDIAVGFSDEWFELKYGVERLLTNHLEDVNPGLTAVNVSGGPRWDTHPFPWNEAAPWIAGAKLFVGCCSSLHVLACAVGTPAIIVEPAPARHHDCFYPFGKQGPEVELLKGADGLPTFDARHLCNAVDSRLGLEVSA